MRVYAERCGERVPDGDLLDNELVFVNYRLMSRRLGITYANDGRDTGLGLWSRGLTLAVEESHSLKRQLSNLLWLSLLLVSPRALARWLIIMRFNR